jgi:hypothetical protein
MTNPSRASLEPRRRLQRVDDERSDYRPRSPPFRNDLLDPATRDPRPLDPRLSAGPSLTPRAPRRQPGPRRDTLARPHSGLAGQLPRRPERALGHAPGFRFRSRLRSRSRSAPKRGVTGLTSADVQTTTLASAFSEVAVVPTSDRDRDGAGGRFPVGEPARCVCFSDPACATWTSPRHSAGWRALWGMDPCRQPVARLLATVRIFRRERSSGRSERR